MHLHAVLLAPNDAQILRALPEDQHEGTIEGVKMLFEYLQYLDHETNQNISKLSIFEISLGQPWKAPRIFPGANRWWQGVPTPCRAGRCDQQNVVITLSQLLKQLAL